MKNMANLNNYSNEPIGEWKIGGGDHFIAFALTKKPHWFHRLSARFFFGLRWVDYVDGKGSKPSKGISISQVSNPKPRGRFKS